MTGHRWGMHWKWMLLNENTKEEGKNKQEKMKGHRWFWNDIPHKYVITKKNKSSCRVYANGRKYRDIESIIRLLFRLSRNLCVSPDFGHRYRWALLLGFDFRQSRLQCVDCQHGVSFGERGFLLLRTRILSNIWG